MRRGWAPAAAALLAAAVAACGGGDGSRAGSGGDSTASRPAAVSPARPTPARPDSEGVGIAVTAAHPAPGTWVLSGTAPGPGALELTVEDGASVVYGPESVPIRDGRFRAEVSIREVAQGRTLQAYIGDPAGMQQAAIVLNP
jgi:hypothetical protein